MIGQFAAALLVAALIADGGASGVKAEIKPRQHVIEAQRGADEATEALQTIERTKHLYGTCTVTHYCGCAACCGAWGNNTASGARPTSGWTVANNVLPFGTKVEINGQIYCVEDRGDDKMNDYWFDIYCDGHQEALDRGMYSAPVYIVEG